MNKLLYSATILAVICCACQNNTPNNTINEEHIFTTESLENDILTDNLEDYQVKLAEKNIGYIHLADGIWKHRKTTSDIFSEEMEWLHLTQKQLTAAFDSIYAGNDVLNDIQKADSMASILAKFLDTNEDANTTWDMVINTDIKKSFVKYNLISSYAKLQQLNPIYTQEIKSWMKLEHSLLEYLLPNALLQYYGGSMGRINASTSQLKLLTLRQNIVNNLLNEKQTNKDTTSVATAKETLLKAIDDNYSLMEKNRSIYEDEQLKGYDELLKQMSNGKQRIPNLLTEWLASRNNFGHELIDDNTIALLNGLTSMLNETD